MPRLVVIELHHLGDAVLALPFLRAAAARYHTSVLCRPAVAGLLRELLPDLDVLSAPETWPARLVLLRKLGLSTEDVTVCVWADARAHGLMRFSGAGHRVGFPMSQKNYYASGLPWRRRRLHFGKLLSALMQTLSPGPLLTQSLTRSSPSQSHLSCWTQLADALEFPLELDPPWIVPPKIDLPNELGRFLDERPGIPVLILHPGGRLSTKRWPKFQELVERLTTDNSPAVVIVQVPGEPAPQPRGPNQIAVASPDWRSLLSLVQSASLVLCNDSLASHLAAALNRPVLTIFGSGNPDWFAAHGPGSHFIATDACRHRPCIDRCVMPSPICLESVTVDAVETRLREILAKLPGADGQ